LQPSEQIADSLLSPPMHVRPEWIDINGHMNLAYYQVLFDMNVDRAFEQAGIGASYVRRTNHSFFAAEVHLMYRREVKLSDPVRVALRLLDFDEKRLHFYSEMVHATEGWLACISENLSLHIDLERRKVAPFLPEATAALASLRQAQAHLPWPEAAGRRISMSGRP